MGVVWAKTSGFGLAERQAPGQRHQRPTGELLDILASADPFEVLDVPGDGSAWSNTTPGQRHQRPAGDLLDILASADPFEVLDVPGDGSAWSSTTPRPAPPAPTTAQPG